MESKITLLYGTRQSPHSPFIPMRRISSCHFGHEGLTYYSLGLSSGQPNIIENRSDLDFEVSTKGIDTLKWCSHSITARPGLNGEESVVRLKVGLSGDYFIIIGSEAQVVNGKPAAVSVGLNNQIVWRSATPDTFIGNMSLQLGDQIDISFGLLPFQDYSDTAAIVRFGCFLMPHSGSLVCIDEKRSSFHEQEIIKLAASKTHQHVYPNMRAITEKQWHRQVFNTMMRYDDKKHLEACFLMPFDGLFDFLYERNIKTNKKYVILFTPRSGSSLLTECLSQTNVLGKPLEYFVEHALPILLQPQIEPANSILEALFAKFSSDNGVFGFEVDYERYFGAEEALIENVNDWSVFYMTRRDILAQAVSLHCAMNFGIWNVNSADVSVPLYDRVSIVRYVAVLARMMLGFEKYFVRINIAPKRIVYEDFIADVDGTLRSIAEVLDINPDQIGCVDLSKTAQRKLAGGERLSWARDVLTTGGNYKGFNIGISNAGFLAILADADINGIDRPQDYEPLGFCGVSEAEVKTKIDNHIANLSP